METDTYATPTPTPITSHHSLNKIMRTELRTGQNPRLQEYYQVKRGERTKTKENRTRVTKKMNTTAKIRKRKRQTTLIVTMN